MWVKESEEDLTRAIGPALRWSTGSSEANPLRLLTMALIAEGSASCLTLKSTTCSTNSLGLGFGSELDDDSILMEGWKRDLKGL